MSKFFQRKSRGITGVEAAIILIAFVIVATGFAFMVLNMGFTVTQEARTTIGDSLDEAASTMEVAGNILGVGHVTQNALNATTIPIKIATGATSANLDPDAVSIRYVSATIAYDNIYDGVVISQEFNGTASALEYVADPLNFNGGAGPALLDVNPMDDAGWPAKTMAFVWFSQNINNNAILELGELVMVTIVWSEDERPQALDNIVTEVILPTGPTLSVDRDVPSITNEIVLLG
jgi:flagellin FlaB